MTAYYNEIEPFAAQWLRNLISAGLIAPGEVDTRSIKEVQADDLRGFTQCHFFAGIGGWSYAARLAGWPDDRPLWTGSCPCQPFSHAGKRQGQADERHLWPDFFRLILDARPPVVMGEQVAAAIGRDWLDGVFSDLGGIGYACGAAVIPACAVDAPHRRDRAWFVADAGGERRRAFGDGYREHERPEPSAARESGRAFVADALRFGDRSNESVARTRQGEGADGKIVRSSEGLCEPMADADGRRRQSRDRNVSPAGYGDSASASGRVVSLADARSGRRCRPGEGQDQLARRAETERAGDGPLGDAVSTGLERLSGDVANRNQPGRHGADAPRSVAATGGGFWRDAGWIVGADGKARRVKPGLRLLVDGVSARVGRLRAYGNAIVPQVAAEVIGAYLDCEIEQTENLQVIAA